MRQLWTTRTIDAPADVVWHALVTPDLWPQWGPTVRDVESDGTRLQFGTTGAVVTVGGARLPFVVTEFEQGRRWAWRVAGVTATDHRVEPLGNDRCRASFGVPLLAAPYVFVCRVALRRLDRMATMVGVGS